MNNARFVVVSNDEEDNFIDDSEKLVSEHETLAKILSNKEFKKYYSLYVIPRRDEVQKKINKENEAKEIYRLQGELRFFDAIDLRSIQSRKEYLEEAIKRIKN